MGGHSFVTPSFTSYTAVCVEAENASGSTAVDETHACTAPRAATVAVSKACVSDNGTVSANNVNLIVAIVASQKVKGVTWYLLRAQCGTEEKFYAKRYSEFAELHKTFLASGDWASQSRTIPTLPKPGLTGFRHRFNLGKFNQRRLQGLEAYVERVSEQVDGSLMDPALELFLGAGAPGECSRWE